MFILCERKWRGCIEAIDFLVDHSAIWGEHPCVNIIVYEHNVHLNYKLCELCELYRREREKAANDLEKLTSRSIANPLAA